jgi:hypothetical protein
MVHDHPLREICLATCELRFGYLQVLISRHYSVLSYGQPSAIPL